MKKIIYIILLISTFSFGQNGIFNKITANGATTFNEGSLIRITTPASPILELRNLSLVDRTTKMLFSNQSALFSIGMMDSSATMFQIKEGSSAYFNVNRTDGKIQVGKDSGIPEVTFGIKNSSAGGSTSFRIQAGATQTTNFIECLYNDNTQAFTVDKNSNILYNKNLNKLIVISGDSWSNDVSQFGSNGDFPTYFLYNQDNHDWQHRITAVAGRTVATMLANYNSEILPYGRYYEHQERILILYGGINDLFANRTAVNIYNDLKSMWLNSKNNGFKTVAFRICESTDLTGPQEAERVALNNLISSDISLFDYLIYTDVLFPDASDTTFFADGTHLNFVGAHYLGQHVYKNIYENKFNTVATNSIISGYKEEIYGKSPLVGNSDYSSNYSNNSYVQKKYVDRPVIRTVSSSTNLTPSDKTLNISSGTFTVTIDTAVGFSGVAYEVVNSGTGIITLDANGSETINGALTLVVPSQCGYTIKSDGSNWIVTDRFKQENQNRTQWSEPISTTTISNATSLNLLTLIPNASKLANGTDGGINELNIVSNGILIPWHGSTMTNQIRLLFSIVTGSVQTYNVSLRRVSDNSIIAVDQVNRNSDTGLCMVDFSTYTGNASDPFVTGGFYITLDNNSGASVDITTNLNLFITSYFR